MSGLDGLTVVDLAIRIADNSVRSDIELFARPREIEGLAFFDLAAPAGAYDAAFELDRVRQAVEYINARGDVFPWHMKRHISSTTLVRFEEKV